MHIRRRRVIEQLVTRGILTEAQLAQSHVPERVRPSAVVQALAKECAVPAVDVRALSIAPELWGIVPFEIADKHVLVPLAREGNTLKIAIADPTNIFALDDLRFLTGLAVDVAVGDEADLLWVIHTHHHRMHNRDLPSMRPSLSLVEKLHATHDAMPHATPVYQETDPPVVKLVNLIIVDAVKKRAHEIVIEPRAHDAVVCFAIGGRMEEVMKPPKSLLPAMVGRLRTMGGEQSWFTLKDVIDVDQRFFATRFGTQVSLRLFARGEILQLFDDVIALTAFADAARIMPGSREGRVDLHTAKGWRPTWTYPMSRHACLVASAREAANVDVTDDECANGVRLFLRKRSCTGLGLGCPN